MSKKQQEIHETDSLPWIPVEGMEGAVQKILNVNPESGSISRLLKFSPGAHSTEKFVHDFYEEVYIIEGSVMDTTLNLTFHKGYYGYRHPGMIHGPYYSPNGALQFEVRNFEKC